MRVKLRKAVTNVRYMAHAGLHHLPMEAVLDVTDFKPAEGLMDNTQVKVGYIAHVAVPCYDLEETARWYAEVLGAQPVRILPDRVTFSFGGVLQLVCHLERRAGVANARAYPRHHGLTFLRMEDFDRLKEHLVKLGVKFIQRPALRFATTAHEHQTMMLADPSGNVVEFKCYVRPECSY